MTTIYRATARFFNSWYQPKYKMDQDDWLFIAALTGLCALGWNIGLVIGYIWIKLL